VVHLYLVLVLVIVYWTYRLIQYKPGELLSRVILGNNTYILIICIIGIVKGLGLQLGFYQLSY
jgi:hypothetical protein